jgi:hypothetical protein
MNIVITEKAGYVEPRFDSRKDRVFAESADQARDRLRTFDRLFQSAPRRKRAVWRGRNLVSVEVKGDGSRQ